MWIEHKIPQYGDKRTKYGFVWWPKSFKVGGVRYTVWLQYARWTEAWTKAFAGRGKDYWRVVSIE